MARKKKTELPPRNVMSCIRMTSDLKAVLEHNAAAAKLSFSDYCRKVLSGEHPPVHQELVFNDPQILKIFSNLGHCGGNLNQLAKHLNQGGEINQQVRDQIIECISELYEMRDSLSRLAGEYRGSN